MFLKKKTTNELTKKEIIALLTELTRKQVMQKNDYFRMKYLVKKLLEKM